MLQVLEVGDLVAESPFLGLEFIFSRNEILFLRLECLFFIVEFLFLFLFLFLFIALFLSVHEHLSTRKVCLGVVLHSSNVRSLGGKAAARVEGIIIKIAAGLPHHRISGGSREDSLWSRSAKLICTVLMVELGRRHYCIITLN
ncbi:hypothetical protein FGO68_gene7952 [Halteria grandinella]|uniref:Uncharacterized protein n=1 Tax=Halteria grandinella TaxID=5974 RepID=A0A8J8NSK1_HALGN|nr:hypothetical protein FGO68_gene7952 [Halteria grandinella]